jgi:hypothetical protein
MPHKVNSEPIPDNTALLPIEDNLPSHYRRGIIGKQDKTLEPMIRAGTFVLINTHKRAIAHRREWTNEFDRPIYFLYTRSGYLCGALVQTATKFGGNHVRCLRLSGEYRVP